VEGRTLACFVTHLLLLLGRKPNPSCIVQTQNRLNEKMGNSERDITRIESARGKGGRSRWSEPKRSRGCSAQQLGRAGCNKSLKGNLARSALDVHMPPAASSQNPLISVDMSSSQTPILFRTYIRERDHQQVLDMFVSGMHGTRPQLAPLRVHLSNLPNIRPKTDSSCHLVSFLWSTMCPLDMWEGIESATQEYIDKSIAEDLGHIEAVYLNRTTKPKGNFWVAHRENSEELLGMVGMQYLNDEECELRRMSVASKARREGIGSLLVMHLLEAAKAEGFKKCTLSTLTRMMPGRKMYEKLGFKETKTEDVAPNVTVIYYERHL